MAQRPGRWSIAGQIFDLNLITLGERVQRQQFLGHDLPCLVDRLPVRKLHFSGCSIAVSGCTFDCCSFSGSERGCTEGAELRQCRWSQLKILACMGTHITAENLRGKSGRLHWEPL
jgi:hypothetical protein